MFILLHSSGNCKRREEQKGEKNKIGQLPYVFLSFIFGDFSKTGQCFPVARKTSALGSIFDLIPNTLHALGNRGSQDT